MRPAISVILATYNWSAALECALTSVIAQTHSDFEVLIVGDACTDDSEARVKGFADERLNWFNLPINSGSQYGPNNFALSRARGLYVAYLGQDDIWWPTHLEAGLRAFRETGADMVAATAVLYGPAETGFKGITGLFPDGEYSPRHHIPPSSMMHRRDLIDKVGGWRPPDQAVLGIDYDFVMRSHEAGAKIVSTGDLTVFKFTASWRRDAYRRKSVAEQQALLNTIRTGGEHFRYSELLSLLRCVIEDRFIKLETAADPADRARTDTGFWADAYARFKGARSVVADYQILGLGRHRFGLDEAFSGFEWYSPESHPTHGNYRWSGPSRRSTIPLRLAINRPAGINLHVVYAIDPTVLASARLSVNERPVQTTIEATSTGTWLIKGHIEPDPEEHNIEVVLEVERTRRPFDVLNSQDRRWLGLAINWIEFEVRSQEAGGAHNGIK